MAQPKKPITKKGKGKAETHWCALDVRSEQEKLRAMEYMASGENVLAGVIDILLAGGGISLKPEDDTTFLGFVFQEISHNGFSSIGIRAESKDPYKMIGALTYKYNIMLQNYELPSESEDVDDFR